MDINFPSFESLTNYKEYENPIELFREMSGLIMKSKTIPEMRTCLLRLRQLRKFRRDTFAIILGNDLEEFCQKFMDYEEPDGKEEIIFETMLFFREFILNPNDKIDSEPFQNAFFDALEPFFHFPHNIQIQNFARESLALYVSDVSNTSSISKTVCEYLTTTDQELLNFWNQRLNNFLTTLDGFNLGEFFDWAKIMIDIQGKYNDDLYTVNNLKTIKLFLNQLRNIVEPTEKWYSFESECIEYSFSLIEKEKREFEKKLEDAKDLQQKALSNGRQPGPLPVYVQHKKECFLTRDN